MEQDEDKTRRGTNLYGFVQSIPLALLLSLFKFCFPIVSLHLLLLVDTFLSKLLQFFIFRLNLHSSQGQSMDISVIQYVRA